MRQIHELVQGTPEWEDYRLQHHGASEAAAMLGISKLTKRTELLNMKATGNPKVFSDWVQEHILDHGHKVEALARPHIEALLGEDLYPVTMSLGKLSASCDGLTIDDRAAFEHKQWNVALAASVEAGVVPDEHMPQCQQILLVTGAEQLYFVVSDGTAENMVHCIVEPDLAYFKRLHLGWAQFEADLANHQVKITNVTPVGRTFATLPSLMVQVKGEVLASNLVPYREHAVAAIKAINRDLKTDQDFADADKAAKWCSEIEERMGAVKAHALGQTESLDQLFRTMDDISAEARNTRLELNSLIKARKEQRRAEIVSEPRAAFIQHIAALNKRPGQATDADRLPRLRSGHQGQALVRQHGRRGQYAAGQPEDRRQRSGRPRTDQPHAAGPREGVRLLVQRRGDDHFQGGR